MGSSPDCCKPQRLHWAHRLAEHPAQPLLPAIDLVKPSLLREKLAKRDMARLVSSPWHSGQAAGASAWEKERSRSNFMSQCGQ